MHTQRLSLQELTPIGDQPVIPAPHSEETEASAQEKGKISSPSRDNAEPTPEDTQPPAITFSEDELQASKNLAYEAGKEAGFIEGRQTAVAEIDAAAEALNQTISHLLESLNTKINTLFSSVENENPKHFMPIVTRLALGIAQKVTNNTSNEHIKSRIEQVTAEALGLLFNEPSLTLYVHENMTPALQEMLDTLKNQKGFHGSIALQPDASLEESDCRIEWKDGCITHSNTTLWDDVRKTLQLDASKDDINNIESTENENTA